MLDTSLAIANAALCVGAIVCGVHFPAGRWRGVALAVLLLASFFFCALGYTEYKPRYAAEAIGLIVTTKETWLLADTVGGLAAILLAARYWWGWALWGCAVAQVITHGARISFGIDENLYTDALQVALWLQLSVFYFVGGRGVLDTLHRCLVNLSSPGRALASATGRRAAQGRKEWRQQ